MQLKLQFSLQLQPHCCNDLVATVKKCYRINFSLIVVLNLYYMFKLVQ